MKKYLNEGSIKPWKAFLFFQLLGWIVIVALLSVVSVALPKAGVAVVAVLVAIPYALYAASVLWVNIGSPKTSIKSALAKLWCILYVVYAVGVSLRVVTVA